MYQEVIDFVSENIKSITFILYFTPVNHILVEKFRYSVWVSFQAPA